MQNTFEIFFYHKARFQLTNESIFSLKSNIFRFVEKNLDSGEKFFAEKTLIIFLSVTIELRNSF